MTRLKPWYWLVAILLSLTVPIPGATTISLNDDQLFTAPVQMNSPFTVRLTDMGTAPDIMDYNIILEIDGPPAQGMTWDEFGTEAGSTNVFTGRSTFLYPFMAFVDDAVIDISHGLNDPADAISLPATNDLFANCSVWGGTDTYGWYVNVHPDSYVLDSFGTYHDVVGARMPIIQPEPASVTFLIAALLYRRKRRDDR